MSTAKAGSNDALVRRVEAGSAEEWWTQQAILLAEMMRRGGVRMFRIELTPRGTYGFELDPIASPNAQRPARYCDDPDNCTYSDCPTAFCDRNFANGTKSQRPGDAGSQMQTCVRDVGIRHDLKPPNTTRSATGEKGPQ